MNINVLSLAVDYRAGENQHEDRIRISLSAQYILKQSHSRNDRVFIVSLRYFADDIVGYSLNKNIA